MQFSAGILFFQSRCKILQGSHPTGGPGNCNGLVLGCNRVRVGEMVRVRVRVRAAVWLVFGFAIWLGFVFRQNIEMRFYTYKMMQ